MLMMAAALGAEVLLLLLVAMGVVIVRGRSAKRRDRDAMRALIARVKKGKPEREKVIEQFLMQRMSLEGEALEHSRVAMLRAEMALLQRFVAVYRDRDARLAGRFDSEIVAALEPYHALSATAAAMPEADEAIAGDEVERLKKDIARLEDELRITMETMSRMLNEYSTMFAGGTPDNAAPIAAAAAASTAAFDAAADIGSADGESLFQQVGDDSPSIPETETLIDDAVADGGDEALEVQEVDVQVFVEPEKDVAESADEEAAVADSVEPLAIEPEVELGVAALEEGVDQAIKVDAEADDLHDAEKDITLTDGLFDAIEDGAGDVVEIDEMDAAIPVDADAADSPVNPEPVEDELLSATSAPADSVDDGAPDDDDPIAQILREAEFQERSARGEVTAAGDTPQSNKVDVDDVDQIMASAGVFEEGEVEVMAGEDGSLPGLDEETLFDAADEILDDGDSVSVVHEEDLFDAVSDTSKSGSAS
jgi:hypothetical protein